MKKVGKTLFAVLYLFVPMCLVRTSSCISAHHDSVYRIFVIGVYLITITGIVIFFKYRPSAFSFLIIGLLFSPLWTFIYERGLQSAYFPLLITMVSTVYYALPFSLISTIVYFVIRKKRLRVEGRFEK